jgi:hypothetical protein
MLEKLFNYFATIPGLPRAVGRAGILQKIPWRVRFFALAFLLRFVIFVLRLGAR